MAKTEQMLRLKFIQEILKKKREKGATFEEINDYLYKKFEEQDCLEQLYFAKRTFQRDIKAIERLSGITITYSRQKKTYYISHDELEENSKDILDSILLIEAYREIKDKANIMLFDERKAKGHNLLNAIIHAITNNLVISFTYEKFWDPENGSKRTVEPYALKEVNHRWYLLAKEFKSEDEKLKTFGLDRISDLDFSHTKFSKESIDVNKAFKNSFGIVSTLNEEPQRIVLEFDYQQGKYIKTLPLHASQKVISEDNKKIVISVELVPTYDFRQEILSYGNRVKVLEPESFIEDIKNELKSTLRKYRKSNK